MSRASIIRQLKVDRWLYLMLSPGVIFFMLFKYGPMWGIFLSFKNYQPYLGFFESSWAGLDHYIRFFSGTNFTRVLSNTLYISVLNILICFPMPIMIALMLNEVKVKTFKRFVQSMTYIPHFISWVIIASMTYLLFTTEGGLVNGIIKSLGGNEINFLLDSKWFRPMIIGQTLWKETGWGTIIFLAALSGVDVELYEAAKIDGANRFHQLLYITLPSIRSTIVVMLILKLGSVMDTGFDQIFMMTNPINRSIAEVFDTYVYELGIKQGQYSYSATVGMFKSVVSFILVLSANYISKLMGEEGIF